MWERAASARAGTASAAATRRTVRAAFIRVAKSKDDSALILGASPAGLSCAMAGMAASQRIATAAMSRGATGSARYGILLELRIQLQRQLQIRSFIARERHWILTGVAGRAVLRAPALHAPGQPFETEVCDAVGVQVLPDFFHRVRRRDQLGPSRRVNAVKAGRHGGGAADPHV